MFSIKHNMGLICATLLAAVFIQKTVDFLQKGRTNRTNDKFSARLNKFEKQTFNCVLIMAVKKYR
jgi:hypothetical protein